MAALSCAKRNAAALGATLTPSSSNVADHRRRDVLVVERDDVAALGEPS